jgi:plastocyanin
MKILRFLFAGAALLVMASCSGYSNPSMTTPTPTPTPSGANGVTIPSGAETKGAAAYAPNPINVSVGSSVTWTNTDSVTHTVTSDNSVFNSGTLPAGQSYSFTFSTAGTFPYHCTLHPGMVGTVVVQ